MFLVSSNIIFCQEGGLNMNEKYLVDEVVEMIVPMELDFNVNEVVKDS